MTGPACPKHASLPRHPRQPVSEFVNRIINADCRQRVRSSKKRFKSATVFRFTGISLNPKTRLAQSGPSRWQIISSATPESLPSSTYSVLAAEFAEGLPNHEHSGHFPYDTEQQTHCQQTV